MRRVNKRELDAAMFPIDTLVDLGHPNDARISERHRPIPICLMQLEQGRDMLLDAGRDPILNAPFSRSSNSASCALGKAREEIHRLGQHWLAYEQRRVQFLDLFDYSGWCCSAQSRKATNGPVSTMAGPIATEAFEVLRIGCEVRKVHRSACALYQAGEALTLLRYARGFKHEPQPLLDQVLELAATQRRLRLAGGRDHPNFDCGLHSNYFEPMIRPAPLA
jgi:hypothetical protein